MWNNIVERYRLQTTVWHMRIACCITKATQTHLQYVILIAFPYQQLFNEPTLLLRYTYIASLVVSYKQLPDAPKYFKQTMI